MSETDIAPSSVPLPPPVLPGGAGPRLGRFAAAVAMITLGWSVILAVVVAATVRIQRWETAPGEALAVASRLSFAPTKGGAPAGSLPRRFTSPGGIRFVTAFSGQLSALDAALGWLDPHVDVETYRERFGDETPTSRRELGFQSMFGAKQVAEYVAMKRLGFDVTLTEGLVIVSDVVCAPSPRPRSACRVLETGDTVVSFAGTKTPTLAALSAAIEGHRSGETVEVVVVPAGSEPDDADSREVRLVELMSDPDEPARVIVGFVPADTRTVVLPFEVVISTTDIGGPSAGLAFTLGLLDELSEGNLVGRGTVVATGTISPDGTVGAIGALRQKAVAVRDAGATLFLVPSGQDEDELAEAAEAAGPGVRIVPVGSLDEALAALAANGGDPFRRP